MGSVLSPIASPNYRLKRTGGGQRCALSQHHQQFPDATWGSGRGSAAYAGR